MDIENDLVPLGLAKESREFKPHLTLARFKEFHPHDREALKLAYEPDLTAHVHSVNAVTLFQSRLTPNGPIYSVLEKISLKQN